MEGHINCGSLEKGMELVVLELCEKVVEVKMVSDRVMTVVVVFEDVLRLICGHALQSR